MAGELYISERTVETHVRNALKKLGMRSRFQLAEHWSGDDGPSAAGGSTGHDEAVRGQGLAHPDLRAASGMRINVARPSRSVWDSLALTALDLVLLF